MFVHRALSYAPTATQQHVDAHLKLIVAEDMRWGRQARSLKSTSMMARATKPLGRRYWQFVFHAAVKVNYVGPTQCCAPHIAACGRSIPATIVLIAGDTTS